MDESDALTLDAVEKPYCIRVQEEMYQIRKGMSLMMVCDRADLWAVWNQTSAAVGPTAFSRQDWLRSP